VKISMFHLMPHRELPADFEQRYKSVWVDPPFAELADPNRVGQYYNWTLDELIHAAHIVGTQRPNTTSAPTRNSPPVGERTTWPLRARDVTASAIGMPMPTMPSPVSLISPTWMPARASSPKPACLPVRRVRDIRRGDAQVLIGG
jgi:hypothetical protein